MKLNVFTSIQRHFHVVDEIMNELLIVVIVELLEDSYKTNDVVRTIDKKFFFVSRQVKNVGVIMQLRKCILSQ